MRHKIKGRKLNRTSSHKKALMRSLATSLFEHKKISTTVAKAKELRPYAEKLITKAKHAVKNEKQGLLPEGQSIDIHNRRSVYKNIRNKAVLQELFDVIAPLVEDRDGGYTRIIKTGHRRGDGASLAIIELVDWSAPKDGASNMKKKRRKQEKKVKEESIKEIETKEEELEEIETFDDVETEEEVKEKTSNEAVVEEESKEEAKEENTTEEKAEDSKQEEKKEDNSKEEESK